MSATKIPTAEFVKAIWQPGDVREVRILTDGAPAVGYFDDPDLLVGQVDQWDGKGQVYITLNPVQPALLARYPANMITPRAKATTSARDILRRRWLLVDLDPNRPAGISSSDAEREAARRKARELYAYLRDQGWSEPLSASTGNGFALLYPVDLPNDEAATRLVEDVLAHLDERFSDEAVKIDVAVGDPGRIGRLLGTMNIKGQDTPERPHRRSELLKAPDTLIPVPLERLQALAPATNGHRAEPRGSSLPHGWVRDWLDAADVAYREHAKDGITYYRLDRCPVHPDDDIGGDCAVWELPSGAAVFRCLHDRGKGKDWAWLRAELRLGPSLGTVSRPGGHHQNGSVPVDILKVDAGARWLSEVDASAPPPRLLDRWDGKGLSLAYGPSGVGKGVLLSHDAGLLVRAGYRPLLVDYESHADEYARRITALYGAEVTAQVLLVTPLDPEFWKGPSGPIWDIAATLREIVEGEGRDIMLIDSLGPACMGMGMNDPDTPQRFTQATQLICPLTIAIGQVNRAGDLSAPFGSVFWRYWARAMQSVERAPGHSADNEQRILLTDRKANNYARAQRQLLTVDWTDDLPVQVGEQPYALAMADLIEAVIGLRNLTVTEICEELNAEVEETDHEVKADTVRKALRRGLKARPPRFAVTGKGSTAQWSI